MADTSICGFPTVQRFFLKLRFTANMCHLWRGIFGVLDRSAYFETTSSPKLQENHGFVGYAGATEQA